MANSPAASPGRIVHAVKLLDAETLDEPVVDHRLGAGATFLGRLKHQNDGAGKIACLGEVSRRAQQHGGVTVMTAGVHLAGIGRRVIGAGGLDDRQRVHIGAQRDGMQCPCPGPG